MRSPNTVDFWRGFALLEIVINHIPGNGLTRLTHSQFSWSDAAELFVFLAGWAFARRLNNRKGGLADMASFISVRLGKIWVGQIATALVVVAVYLLASRALNDPGLLADNNASLVVGSPGPFLLGVLMMTEQMRYVDILPLYALLSIATPVIYFINRRSTALLLALSGGLFCLALFWRVRLPTWPDDGHWFFEPFSWQAMFVIGYVVGRERNVVERLTAKAPLIVPIAWSLVALSFVSMVLRLTPDGEPAVDSIAYYFFGKSSLGLLPIPQFLALAFVASRMTPLVPRYLSPLWSMLSFLGRNSLSVFCAGTVLSAIGQICHRAGFHGILFDALFMIAATAVLCAVAWMRESFKAAGSKTAARPSGRATLSGEAAQALPAPIR